MSSFTPVSALAGGALIGLSASIVRLRLGKATGVSGILERVVTEPARGLGWEHAFLLGMFAAGAAATRVSPGVVGASPRGLVALAVAGLLVGFGTRLGGGCTSGHGVCGLARLAPRSLVATLTFMATGIVTAVVVGRLS